MTSYLCVLGRNPLLRSHLMVAVVTFLAAHAVWAGPVTAAAALGAAQQESEVQVWEIGVEVSSQRPVRNLSVVFPIVMDWPEQRVEVLSQEASANVGRVKVEELPPGARIASARISQVAPEAPARVVFRIQVEKQFPSIPADAQRLKFFSRAPGGSEQFLRPSPYIESNHRRIRELADSIPVDAGASAWDQVEAIYDALREKFPYRFDEQIKTCIEAIEQGHGDCEELSSLFIAVCRARGIPARAVWVVDHTYPEFLLSDERDETRWIPVQMAGSRSFGEMPESRVILQKGDNFRVPGNNQRTRYVQPTLVGGDAAAGLGLSFFCRPVD